MNDNKGEAKVIDLDDGPEFGGGDDDDDDDEICLVDSRRVALSVGPYDLEATGQSVSEVQALLSAAVAAATSLHELQVAGRVKQARARADARDSSKSEAT